MPLIIEIFAIVFAILYLVLAAFENNWCWLFAGLSTVLYVFICYDAQLYLETILQFFYLFMAVYGFLQWRKKENNSAVIHRISFQFHLKLIAVAEIGSLLAGYYFSNYTVAALPWMDAHITVYSIVATYMVTKKMIENWLWWFVIDALAVYLYFAKDLKLTALLYFAYVVMVVFGYFKWKKEIQKL
ncbi:MAG: nicotinamide riboside transporter PnuC [Bacteroidota bacterium]